MEIKNRQKKSFWGLFSFSAEKIRHYRMGECVFGEDQASDLRQKRLRHLCKEGIKLGINV
ncbi:hypothetical protein [Methylomonas sp. AM2-LC]|uniref:hypothetical protein n=1 Tax=Methylomonas sp. AM2-LC TaxID=3153301 RepID=UPI0032670FFC